MNHSTHLRAMIFDFLRTGEAGSRMLHFSNGQSVFQPNDPAIDLFLVERGEIRLFQVVPGARRNLLAILGESELFGISSLGSSGFYGKVAVSIGNSQVRAIPAQRLRDAIHVHGDLAVQFVEILASQLHSCWTEETRLFSEDCHLRLIRKLIGFASSPAAQPVAGGVELHITHAQLAQAIGAARETVSICLMQLRRENLVETRRNRVIYDPQRLTQAYPDALPTPDLAIAV